MGEEETVAEAAENGTNTTWQGEDVHQKKDEENDVVNEMEEGDNGDEKVETEKMDKDTEGKVDNETKEEDKMDKDTEGKVDNETKEEDKMDGDIEGKEDYEIREEEKKVENEIKKMEDDEKEETRSEAMEEENEAKETVESEEKVDELKEEDEGAEQTPETKQEKASKRRGKGKTSRVKVNSSKKKVEEKKEQKTPVASLIDRPIRERKSVERLVAVIEKESVKEFHIEKGRGTALKDIPNVAYKLSKKKADDTFKLLHTILFGRRGKAVQIKSNISRFSGFVWNENEEKQKIKVKEKLDKCVKEKLLEFCDVLDIPIAKATTRKEDIVTKLMDFLVAPHATTAEILSDKDQSSKGKKRKRVVKRSASMSDSPPSKHSAKIRRRIGNASKEADKDNAPETEDELDEEEEEEEEEEHENEEPVNGVPEISKNDVPEDSESEENKDEFEDESEEDTGKRKRGSKKSSAKKESASKTKIKKVATPKKSSSPTKRTHAKSSSNRSKVDDSNISPKTFSRKKRIEDVKEKSSTPKKPASTERTGKIVMKRKDKPKEDKIRPSDDELRNAICEILKEVDFNTATFTDILKQLAGRFKTDLTPRKSSIKLMIQDELTKLADEADDEEDEGDAEKDEPQPATHGVEA